MKRFLLLIILFLAVGNICQAASSVPLLNAFLQSPLDGRGQGVTNVYLTAVSMTTTQRLAFTPSNGTIVYDSTLDQLWQFAGGSWSQLAGGGGGGSTNVTSFFSQNLVETSLGLFTGQVQATNTNNILFAQSLVLTNLGSSVVIKSNGLVVITNGLLQFGTASGNHQTIAWGDATNNQKAVVSLNSAHGGGAPNGDGSELQWDYNQMSFNGEGHLQLTKIFSVNPTAVYLARWQDATTGIPFVPSQAFDFQFAYYNLGEQVSQMVIKAEPQDTNGIVNLQFHDSPPPGSDVTNANGAKRFAIINTIGTQTWGAIISDVQTVAVGSNATLLVDLLHPNEDVRLNGPVTVALTNLGILNSTNLNTETMQVYLNPGLMGNCPITWNFGPAVTTNWESPIGPIAAPTNCPTGSILHFTFTPLIRDGVTNLTCCYQMENFNPAIDALAQSFFTAAPSLLPQESNQVNYLVKDLRKWNLLANWDALYPLVGGNSNACSWNLIDTTKFRVAWTLGSSTFDHTGWTSDGTASFANTQFNPATATTPNYTQNSASMVVYCGTANPTYGATPILFMGAVAGGIRAGIGMAGAAELAGSGLNNSDFAGTATTVFGVSSFVGANIISRTSSTVNALYAPIGGNNSSPDASTGVPNAPFYFGCDNNGGIDRPAALKFETVMTGGAVQVAQTGTMTNILANFNKGLNR